MRATTPARADDDHDDVRGAWIRGEIVGLSEILPGLDAEEYRRFVELAAKAAHAAGPLLSASRSGDGD